MTENLFLQVAQGLADIGFYDFFIPWAVSAAILYGLIRRSGVFGDSVVTPGVVSILIPLFFWSYIVMGADVRIITGLSKFFAQASILMFILVFSLVGVAVFFPNLNEWLLKMENPPLGTPGTWFFIIMIIMIILFFTSGSHEIILGKGYSPGKVGVLILAMFGLFIGLLIASNTAVTPVG